MSAVTNLRDRMSDPSRMDASTEVYVAAGIVGLLGGAAIRFGPSDALEGLFLLVALTVLKVARAFLRGALVVLRLMMGIR